MAISETQTIIDSWETLCYYKRMIRNTSTGSESLLSEGIFVPTYSGILRAGKKVTTLNSTTELIEYTALVFKPDLRRLHIGTSEPTSVSIRFYLSSFVLNSGQSYGIFTIKPWANLSFVGWSSETVNVTSYDAIEDYFVPFDIEEVDYESSTYEVSINPLASAVDFLFEGMKTPFHSFMTGNTIGFAITGINGYADIFSPDYTELTSVRPTISISQTIPYAAYNFAYLDIEITGKSHIIGICRDKDGTPITSSACDVFIYSLPDKTLLGSGTSSTADGSFRIKTECKSSEEVLVMFVNDSLGINGSEIMETFGSSSSSSSSSSSN